MNIDNLDLLQNDIGYKFKNIEFLKNAMRHSSFINEHKLKRADCNERIEFLGDAVLELISSEFLYKKYPTETEGKLTKMRAKLVCESSLALAASEFSLGKHILLGKGEDRSGGRSRDSVVSDACESLIGAIYLDGGFEEAKKFVLKHILNYLEDKQLYTDNKTTLQELLQKDGEGTPVYEIVGESGPEHNKTYEAQVLYKNSVIGAGSGKTKKLAEQAAAKDALTLINLK